MQVHAVGKFFNTAGPGIPEDHYMVDPLKRVKYDEIISLIDRKRYFVLHAPRQTGKTTSLLAMVEKINAEGNYHCVYINVESAQTARNDVAKGIGAILMELGEKIEQFLGDGAPLEQVPVLASNVSEHKVFSSMLNAFCKKLDRPLVLFIDEIDALIGDVLVSVLRQLRAGYADRPDFSPSR
jgi:Cdc6-like AAA superfamily ATPase